MTEKEKYALEEYKLAIQIGFNESQVVNQYPERFILAHTIFLTFIAQVNINGNNIIAMWLRFVGYILTVFWYGSSERRWGWYKFRMAQVRQKEKLCGNFDLAEIGRDFAEGKVISILGDTYQHNEVAMKL